MTETMLWKLKPAGGGQFSPENIMLSPEIDSLNAASRIIPRGAYTTFRTYHHDNVLRLEDHFSRLEETAELAHVPVKLNRLIIRSVLQEAIQSYESPEIRFRITVDIEREIGTIYISCEPLHLLPSEAYEKGVKVITQHLHRQNPKAKLSSFIEKADQIRQNVPESINEVLMVDDQERILEGLTSNFFGFKDGTIWTAEDGVLSGTTRQLVLEEALLGGLVVHTGYVTLSDVPRLEETFITSTSRGVLPVVQIDECCIGSGLPGPVTKQLSQWYQVRVEKELEQI